MKSILILAILFSFSAFADVCICQYPNEDAEYGGGEKIEVPLYQAGCKLWLATEKKCHKRKTININKPLDEFLDKHLRAGDNIRLGYVGHWSSSEEMISYLSNYVEPIRQKYKTSIVIENTACSSMDKPEAVTAYLNGISNKDANYIRVEGNQTTSIGMWDKLLIGFRKADLIAISDSRNSTPIYPKCSEYENKRCTGFQADELGKCVDENNNTKELLCFGTPKKNGYGQYKIKKAKRWLDVAKNTEALEEYVKQEERKLKRLLLRLGLTPNFGRNMVDDIKR